MKHIETTKTEARKSIMFVFVISWFLTLAGIYTITWSFYEIVMYLPNQTNGYLKRNGLSLAHSVCQTMLNFPTLFSLDLGSLFQTRNTSLCFVAQVVYVIYIVMEFRYVRLTSIEIFHHLVTLTGILYTLAYGMSHVGSLLLLGELSTVLLHFRNIFKKNSLVIRNLSEVLFVLVFFCTRILLSGYVLLRIYFHSFSIIVLTVSVLNYGLNVYWLTKMFQHFLKRRLVSVEP